MKKITKILSLILSGTMLLATAAGCKSKKETKLPENLASYLDSGKQYNYFGYSCLETGNFYDQTTYYEMGYSLLNEHYISKFYDTGIRILQPQSAAPANSNMTNDPEYYQNSNLKKTLDMAHNLGKDHSVLITDNRFYEGYNLAKAWATENKITDHTKISLIKAEGARDFAGQYYTTDELDKDVELWLSLYKDEPAFAGVMLQDEPPAYMLRVIGDLYKSIRRVEAKLKAKGELKVDEIMINANLYAYFPNLSSMYPSVEEEFHEDKQQRQHEAYRRYLDVFLTETEAHTLCMDIYPVMAFGIYRMYIVNLQMAAEVAKAHGAKIAVINQTCSYNDGGTSIMTLEEMEYLNNIVMGYGARNIGYYTYYTADGGTTYDFHDWGSCVTHWGEETDIYWHTQKVNKTGQLLAPVILNFDYLTSKTYLAQGDGKMVTTNSDHMIMAENYSRKGEFAEFKKLKGLEIDKEMAVVTELYDDEKDNYMYMVMNTVAPQFDGSNAYQTAKLTFSNEYTHAWVFFDDEYTVQKLDKSHSLSVEMKAGEAYYAIPFKA